MCHYAHHGWQPSDGKGTLMEGEGICTSPRTPGGVIKLGPVNDHAREGCQSRRPTPVQRVEAQV